MLPRLLLHLAVLATACVPAFAQGTTSRVTGTVLDSSGAAIPGAAVRLTNEGTAVTLDTLTSSTGAYAFESIQSGFYTVAVEAAGFKKFASKENQVAIGQPTTVNVTLDVGTLAEQVEVSASAEVIQTSTSGNTGNLFAEQVIKDLPIVGTRGRNPLELVLRQPGVVNGANTGGGFHVHGARDRSWNFTLDGIDINETSAGGSNFSPLRTNPDSLSEFRVLTGNFTADYGRNSGAQVAMITRSGSNELHGTGFWFYRTPRFNANPWQNNFIGAGRPQFIQHIGGGSLGGPIVRNRTFFFGNVQILRASESVLLNRTVLTREAREGVFRYVQGGRNLAAGVANASVDLSGNVRPGVAVGTYNVIANDPDARGFDARMRALINSTPLPNNFTGGDGLNTAFFSFNAPGSERQYDATIKVDHVFSPTHAVYFRTAFGSQDTICDGGNAGRPFFPGGDCIVNTYRRPRNHVFNYRWTLSPTVTNEFVVGRNYFLFDFVGPTTDISQITLSSVFLTIPETFAANNNRALTTWQVVDNLSMVRGAHTIKTGLNLRFQSHKDLRGSVAGQNSGPIATFDRLLSTVDATRFNLPADVNQQFDRPTLDNVVNHLLGRVGRISQAFVAQGDAFQRGLYEYTSIYDEYDFFLADAWKVRPNLTIDLGLRWEPKLSVSTNSPDRLLRPDIVPVAGGPASSTLRWQPGRLSEDQLGNLGPSVGFAWDPFSSGKTAVRGNYRIAYDRLPTFTLSSAVLQNLPGLSTAVNDETLGPRGVRISELQAPALPTRWPSDLVQPPPVSTNNTTVVDPNLQSPTTHQWSFSLQREIAPLTVVDISYFGRRGYNLFGGYNANQTDLTRNGFLEAFRTVQAGGDSPLINQLLGPDTRRTAAETGSQAFRRIFASELRNNAVGTVAANLASRTQANGLLTTLAGLGPNFFVPYPQFLGGVFVIDSNDFSTYHGLEMQVERRFARGLAAQFAYTLSKSMDTRSFDPVFTIANGGTATTAVQQTSTSTPFDINNRRLNYAPSDFDRRHVIQSYWVYELPFGPGKAFGNSASGLVRRLIGGWQVTGALTWQSGRPFTVFGDRTLYDVVAGFANYSGDRASTGQTYEEQGFKWFFSPEERARFTLPAAGELGNSGRNQFYGPQYINIDAVLMKRTAITERINFELRADITNITNTPSFGAPTAVVSSATFGRIGSTVTSTERRMQLGAKINF